MRACFDYIHSDAGGPIDSRAVVSKTANNTVGIEVSHATIWVHQEEMFAACQKRAVLYVYFVSYSILYYSTPQLRPHKNVGVPSKGIHPFNPQPRLSTGLGTATGT